MVKVQSNHLISYCSRHSPLELETTGSSYLTSDPKLMYEVDRFVSAATLLGTLLDEVVAEPDLARLKSMPSATLGDVLFSYQS